MSIETLASIFRKADVLLQRSDNDFSWSGWRDGDEARREVDSIVQALESGEIPDPLDMKVLFAPTGPLQEVSLSSGWASEFLALAREFDRALAELR